MIVTGCTFALLTFDPPAVVPVLLAGICGAAATVYAYTRVLRRRPRFGRLLLAGLRLGAVVLAVLSLLHPAWTDRSEEEEKPDLAVVLDNSLSMAGQAGDKTRYERALQVLQEHLLPRFEDTFKLHVFDLRGERLDPAKLPTGPELDSSRITEALFNVRGSLRGCPVQGIVLLSDGREVGDDAEPKDPARLDVPVYAVEVAAGDDARTASDLAIQSVIANTESLVDNAVRVTVLLSYDDPADKNPIELRLMDGEVPVARQLIRWGRAEHERTAELTFVPRRPGQYAFSVHARSVDASGRVLGEADPDLANNWADFSLAVKPGRITVLYVDGVLRWESKFIRASLDRDPDVNLLTAIRTAPPGKAPPSEGILTPSQLANIDVVVLGDVESSYFAAMELVQLRQWVVDEGGGLFLTGGYNCVGGKGLGASPLSAVLPVTFADTDAAQVEAPFNMKLTDAGFRHPVFSVTGDPVRDRSIWHSMPKLPGCIRIASIKPGARVLALNPEQRGATHADGLPVLVEQQVGKGRTMVSALDSTWQWRTYVGGYTGESTFYDKFWSQVVRYLAGVSADSSRAELQVSVDRPLYEPGEPMEVLIELRPSGGEEASAGDKVDWRITAHATHESGARRQLPLAAAGEDRYRATFTPGDAGQWRINVRAEPRSARHGSLRQSRLLAARVAHADREQRDMRVDRRRLERITQATGGRIVSADEVKKWNLSAEPTVVQTAETIGLWHHPLWVTVLFLALCAEWVLRRLGRLA